MSPGAASFISDAPLAGQATPSHAARAAAFAAASASANQRWEHHNAKAAAARVDSAPREIESPSARMYMHTWRGTGERTEPAVRTTEPASSPLVFGDSDDEVAARTEPRATTGAAIELERERVAFEAHVWRVCARYGFEGPEALEPYMRRANGNVEVCEALVEQDVVELARKYGVSHTYMRDAVRRNHGDFGRVRRAMDTLAWGSVY